VKFAFLVALGAALTACYSPSYSDCSITCPANDCPSGLTCVLGYCRVDPNAQDTCGSTGQDGGGDDASADAPTAFVWSSPTVLIDGLGSDGDPTLSDNLLEIYLSRNNDIYHALRASSATAFGAITIDNSLSDPTYADEGPDLSADGLKIFFVRDGPSNRDINKAVRAPGVSWTVETPPYEIDLGYNNAAPTVSRDRQMIVWERLDEATYSLWTADFNPGANMWQNPRALTETESWPFRPHAPMLSMNKLTLYVHADDGQIYEAHRTSLQAMFGMPTPVIGIHAVGATDFDPWISADNTLLVFMRTMNGTRRIMQATRDP
jgi:hypothetical protein